uniref:SPOR domain-containing protein n=1 Tax=candidate division WOR-3 bacterium TaxID=2052148 RepID=A0A7C4UHA6_UNCW3
MKRLILFLFVFSLISCVKHVKPTTETQEPVFIEKDTTTYKPVEIVKDTTPKITEIPPVVEPPKVEETKKVYWVQIDAFSNPANAEKEKSEISSIFKVPVFVKYEGGFYKVRVGEFNTREEAEAFLNKLKSSGFGGIIREEEKK